jgi:Cu(I)/Ag(I) efflux system periplasmic protein CusF
MSAHSRALAALLLAGALSLQSVVPPAAAQSAPMVDGEVTKVDPSGKKLTIRHGPLTNLDMPAMTMVFDLQDPAIAQSVKPGDKVRFSADRVKGRITVLELEKAE